MYTRISKYDFMEAFRNMDEALVRAVVKQIGGWDAFKEAATDITNHGIDGGFHGFIYYSDTCTFYARNQKHIVAMLEQLAGDLGESLIELVSGFNCLRGSATDAEIGRTLYGPKSRHDTQVANALAWFAGEEVARSYENA